MALRKIKTDGSLPENSLFTVREGSMKKLELKSGHFKRKNCVLRSDGDFCYAAVSTNRFISPIVKHIKLCGYTIVKAGAEGGQSRNEEGYLFHLRANTQDNSTGRVYTFATDTAREVILWVRDLAETIDTLKIAVEISGPTNFTHNVRVTGYSSAPGSPNPRLDEPAFIPLNIAATRQFGIESHASIKIDWTSKDLRIKPPSAQESQKMIAEALADFVKYSKDPAELYTDRKKIAEGGFGEVFLATRQSDKLKTAIKIMQLSRLDRIMSLGNMLNEVGVMRLARGHANVIECLDCYVTSTEVWLVMEYMYGGCLRDLLRWKSHLEEPEIAYVCRETLKALSFLHSKHRIHRDVKSDNILLSLEGEIKVTDFGFSTQLTEERVSRNSHCGTSAWMAPEVIQSRKYDDKADMWSLGILVIELAEGFPPNFALPEKDLFDHVINGPPPALQEPQKWSKDMIHFLSRLVKKNAGERANASELLFHPFLRSATPKKQFSRLVIQSKLLRSKEDAEGWVSYLCRGTVVEPFVGKVAAHMNLEVGDSVVVTARREGWFKGMNPAKQLHGVFPESNVELEIRKKRRPTAPRPSLTDTNAATHLAHALPLSNDEPNVPEQKAAEINRKGSTRTVETALLLPGVSLASTELAGREPQISSSSHHSVADTDTAVVPEQTTPIAAPVDSHQSNASYSSPRRKASLPRYMIPKAAPRSRLLSSEIETPKTMTRSYSLSDILSTNQPPIRHERHRRLSIASLTGELASVTGMASTTLRPSSLPLASVSPKRVQGHNSDPTRRSPLRIAARPSPGVSSPARKQSTHRGILKSGSHSSIHSNQSSVPSPVASSLSSTLLMSPRGSGEKDSQFAALIDYYRTQMQESLEGGEDEKLVIRRFKAQVTAATVQFEETGLVPAIPDQNSHSQPVDSQSPKVTHSPMEQVTALSEYKLDRISSTPTNIGGDLGADHSEPTTPIARAQSTPNSSPHPSSLRKTADSTPSPRTPLNNHRKISSDRDGMDGVIRNPSAYAAARRKFSNSPYQSPRSTPNSIRALHLADAEKPGIRGPIIRHSSATRQPMTTRRQKSATAQGHFSRKESATKQPAVTRRAASASRQLASARLGSLQQSPSPRARPTTPRTNIASPISPRRTVGSPNAETIAPTNATNSSERPRRGTPPRARTRTPRETDSATAAADSPRSHRGASLTRNQTPQPQTRRHQSLTRARMARDT